jgi:hypothetical protein
MLSATNAFGRTKATASNSGAIESRAKSAGSALPRGRLDAEISAIGFLKRLSAQSFISAIRLSVESVLLKLEQCVNIGLASATPYVIPGLHNFQKQLGHTPVFTLLRGNKVGLLS